MPCHPLKYPYSYCHQQIKVNPNSVVIYKKNERDINEPFLKMPNEIFDDQGNVVKICRQNHNIHKGFISDKSASNLKRAISHLFWLNGGYVCRKNRCFYSKKININFVTLTLPSQQLHDDITLKSECLNQFLVELNKKYMNLHYIWRAEKQQNGNIHFHILINKYVKWNYIRSTWNRIIEKLGYVTNYSHKFDNMSFTEYAKVFRQDKSKSIDKIHKSYIEGKKSNFTNPNSTDIQKVANIKNLHSYVAKYMSKDAKKLKEMPENESDKLKIKGKIWYCSSNLLNISSEPINYSHVLDTELDKIFESKFCHTISTDYYIVFCISANELYNLGAFTLFRSFYKSLKLNEL